MVAVGYPAALIRKATRAIRRRHKADPDFAKLPVPQMERGSSDPTSSTTIAPKSAPGYPGNGVPVPLSAYTGGRPSQSEALEKARVELPYPIARAARALHVNQDPLEQHRLILDLGEIVSATLGMLAAAWLREYSPKDPSLNMLHKAFHLRGVSQGHWHDVISAAEVAMKGQPQTALTGFVTGVSKSSKNPSVVQMLKDLLEERNRSAHGARPHNRSEAAVRVHDYMPLVEGLLSRLSFMKRDAWVLVEGVAYRRQDRNFVVQCGVAMSDHPEFESRTVELGVPLANETFYVLADRGPLDLTPFLLVRYCDVCHQPEVCFADRVYQDKGVSLKSVGRGHQIFDAEMVHEFDSLLPQDATSSPSEAG
jgi:hypothetical protein